MMYRYFFTCFLIFSFLALAQDELTDNLKEILVFGRFSPNLQTGYSFDQIPDSLFQNQFGTLQDVLRDEANFYFKENKSLNAKEVHNYIEALKKGFGLISDKKLITNNIIISVFVSVS